MCSQPRRSRPAGTGGGREPARHVRHNHPPRSPLCAGDEHDDDDDRAAGEASAGTTAGGAETSRNPPTTRASIASTTPRVPAHQLQTPGAPPRQATATHTHGGSRPAYSPEPDHENKQSYYEWITSRETEKETTWTFAQLCGLVSKATSVRELLAEAARLGMDRVAANQLVELWDTLETRERKDSTRAASKESAPERRRDRDQGVDTHLPPAAATRGATPADAATSGPQDDGTQHTGPPAAAPVTTTTQGPQPTASTAAQTGQTAGTTPATTRARVQSTVRGTGPVLGITEGMARKNWLLPIRRFLEAVLAEGKQTGDWPTTWHNTLVWIQKPPIPATVGTLLARGLKTTLLGDNRRHGLHGPAETTEPQTEAAFERVFKRMIRLEELDQLDGEPHELVERLTWPFPDKEVGEGDCAAFLSSLRQAYAQKYELLPGTLYPSDQELLTQFKLKAPEAVRTAIALRGLEQHWEQEHWQQQLRLHFRDKALQSKSAFAVPVLATAVEDPPVCYGCNQPGHIRRNCPQRSRSRERERGSRRRDSRGDRKEAYKRHRDDDNPGTDSPRRDSPSKQRDTRDRPRHDGRSDDRERSHPSSPTKRHDRPRCTFCRRVGHVEAECRTKKRALADGAPSSSSAAPTSTPATAPAPAGPARGKIAGRGAGRGGAVPSRGSGRPVYATTGVDNRAEGEGEVVATNLLLVAEATAPPTRTAQTGRIAAYTPLPHSSHGAPRQHPPGGTRGRRAHPS